MNTAAEIMNNGMKCLTNNLGIVDAERFISLIIREQFDYTKWQEEYFDKKSNEELNIASLKYAEENPHSGKAKVIL